MAGVQAPCKMNYSTCLQKRTRPSQDVRTEGFATHLHIVGFSVNNSFSVKTTLEYEMVCCTFTGS